MNGDVFKRFTVLPLLLSAVGVAADGGVGPEATSGRIRCAAMEEVSVNESWGAYDIYVFTVELTKEIEE